MASDQPSIVSPKRTSSRNPPQTLMPGTRVGRYQIGKVVRLGRAGITYRARDTARGCDVALKEYLPVDIAARRSDLNVLPRLLQHVDDFVWGRDRFLAEARALAALATASTPGIVGVDDSLEANGTAYMVTALPPRETLASWLMREGPLAPDRMARLLVPLLDGLAQAHAAGVLHLDIKPANIALDDQGFARLFDFGDARAALAARLPASSAMPATGYTAIEQSTFRETGPFTDIYALAATLYECISGMAPPPAIRRPTERLAAVPRKAAKAHGPRLLSAIQAGLALEPAERPASIAAWRSMLDEAMAAASSSAPTLTTTSPPVRTPAQPPLPVASLDAPLAMAFSVSSAPADTGTVASPIAPLPADAPAETVAALLDGVLASPAAPLLPGMPAETAAPVLDSVMVATPPAATASLRTGAHATTAAPSSSVATDAAMAASLRAIADAVTAAAPLPAAARAATVKPAPITEAAPASSITPVHADPHARPSVIALSGKPGAPAPTAERSIGRPWERWKIALTATLAFATIPAGVAGYYVALPPSPASPPTVAVPAADRLRGASDAQAAAEVGRRALAEADATRRRAQEQADAEAKRSAAAQAEAAARQAAADAEAQRQAEAAARQTAARQAAEAEAEARRQAEAAARQATAQQATEAEAEARRQAEAAARQATARQAAEAEAEARRQAEAAARQVTAQQATEAEAEARRQAEAAARRAAETAAAEAAARRREEEARAADSESRSEAEARLVAAADARRRIEADYARAMAEQTKAAADARQEAAAAEAALKMSNRDKRRVQVALTSLGHDTYGADGSFGQRTRKMIAAWQKSRGEFESGYLTSPDLALLWVQAAPALARYERQLALEEQRRREEEKRLAAEAAAQPPADVIELTPQAAEPPVQLPPPAPPLPQASQTLPPTPPARPQQ